MPKFEATPTEYKGITYRSKCEAMFALYLDLELQQNTLGEQWVLRQSGQRATIQGSSGFIYEPYTGVDGWNPDFLVWRDVGVLIRRRWFQWIEYKPSEPTSAYVKKFAKKCVAWYWPSPDSPPPPDTMAFYIYYGNPYSYPDLPAAAISISPGSYDGKDVESCIEIGCEYIGDWLADSVDALMSYRFDLKDNPGNGFRRG